MKEPIYCSCPSCEAVFVLRKNASRVICGSCNEMFEADLNRVVRVGQNFVPYVSIPPSSKAVEDSDLPGKDPVESDRKSKRPPAEHPSRAGQDEHPEPTDRLEAGPSGTDLPRESEKSEPSESARHPREPILTSPSDQPPESDLHVRPDDRREDAPRSGRAGGGRRPGILGRLIGKEQGTARGKTPSGGGKGRIGQDSAESPGSSHGLERMHEQKSRVDSLIADRKSPLSTVIWSAVTLGFLALLVVQVKTYVVPQYAQVSKYRPYLHAFCKMADCSLPLFRDAHRLTLMHTSIELHPNEPGAVRIKVKMINEAKHPQPFPDLQLTLTDKFGRVVGKRTYSPSVYLPQDTENRMERGILSSVFLDLAKPHENAYGFTVDVVTGV